MKAYRDNPRRYDRYAAKWLAETVRCEPPRHLEPTDENLEKIVGHEHLTRPARRDEFPAIREAIERMRQD